MADLAARKSQENSDSSLQTQGGTASGSLQAGDRRVTADSFRQLLARLKKSADTTAAEAPQAVPAEISVQTPAIEPSAAVAPPDHKAEGLEVPPPIVSERQLQIDLMEEEKRKRARTEVHAASQEIIARLRKAAKPTAPPQPESVSWPVNAEAAAEAPVAETPVAEAPVTETPVAEAAVAEAQTAQAPVAETPAAEAPVAEAPVAELPVAEPPVAEAPVLEMQQPQLESAAAADLAEQISQLRYVEQAEQPTPAQVEEQELSSAIAAEIAATETPVVSPVDVAQPVAEGESPLEAAHRRRHPFFPDVFVDDAGHIEQPADESAVEPEVAEAEPVVAEAQPTVVEAEPEVAEAEPVVQPAPAAEIHQSDDESEQQPDALAVEPVGEAVIELATPAELEPSPPVAPQVLEAETAAPVPAAEQPEVVAKVEAEAEAETDGGHRDDLIEDEADAVKHLHGVEVKGIGDIARAVFSAPTPAERAAFLAEIAAAAPADMVEQAPKEVLAAAPDVLAAPQPTVRKIAPADDPFAKIAHDTSNHVNNEEPDEDSGELARSLLDMMLSGPHAGLPQERALAADALLKLIPKVPTKALITIAERVSLMEQAPHLLIARLINDPRIEISGPLLEQCNHISDQVLGKVIAGGNIDLQRLIARRRHLSPALTDMLIAFDDASVLLTLVRNAGASFSHSAFNLLVDHASRNEAILAPLSTRADLPAPVAFELFWFVPAQLRRYLLSRFLTDSETLTKILKITKVMQAGSTEGEASDFADKADVDAFMLALVSGHREEAEVKLAAVAGITPACAARIVGDQQGEPLAIIFKAIGLNRAQFEECVTKLQQPDIGIVSNGRQILELLSIFNSMSFNKARILLTYWDWAVQKHGPYANAS